MAASVRDAQSSCDLLQGKASSSQRGAVEFLEVDCSAVSSDDTFDDCGGLTVQTELNWAANHSRICSRSVKKPAVDL